MDSLFFNLSRMNAELNRPVLAFVELLKPELTTDLVRADIDHLIDDLFAFSLHCRYKKDLLFFLQF